MSVILVGSAGLAVASGVSETALARWMTAAHLRSRMSLAFEVSRDGHWVRTDRYRPGRAHEEQVLWVATGREVSAAAEEVRARFAGLASPWYRRTQAPAAAGRTAVTIAWPARRIERTFLTSQPQCVRAVGAEGIVFEDLRDEESYTLIRHDLTSGESRTIVRANPRAGATLSPDGERVLMNELAGVSRKNLPEHRGVRVLDAHDGSELAWIEAPWAVVWVGAGHRFVQTELDGWLTVLDLERGTRVPLETHHSTVEHVEVLPDGDLLLQDGSELVLCDGTTGAVVRRY